MSKIFLLNTNILKILKELIYSRPLTSLLIGIYIKFFDLDIFLFHIFLKISLILLSAISFRSLIDIFQFQSKKNLLTYSSLISFWLIIYFEIEAYSHLASIPIFLNYNK